MADESGITIGSFIYDFLILSDALNLTPAPGDVIVANGRQYEVMDIAGQRCWRWSDQYRVTLRIHTKDIGSVL